MEAPATADTPLGMFDRDNIRKNPLLPLVVSILPSGITVMATPVMISMGVGAILLYFDLTVLADKIAVTLVNKRSDYMVTRSSPNAQLAKNAQGSLERAQSIVVGRYKHFARFILASVIISFFLAGCRWAVRRENKAELMDAYLGLQAEDVRISEETVASPEITLRNRSSLDIYLDRFDCVERQLRTTQINLVDSVTGTDYNGAKLGKGGDGESMPCTPTKVLLYKGPRSQVLCGDVQWTVFYFVDGQREKLENKSFRYVLAIGHEKWEQVALSSPATKCEG